MLIESPLAILSASRLIYDMYQSDKIDAQAKASTLKALNRMEEAKATQRQKVEDTKQSLLRLSNRKKGILSSSMKTFVSVYETLKKIEFVASDGILELSDLPATMVQEVRDQILFCSNPMSDAETVVTYVLGGIGGLIKKDSQRNADIARVHAKQARAVEAQANVVSLAYDAVLEQSNRIATVLTRLNVLFSKNLCYTQEIIEKNGTDKKKYSVYEREALATCINLAKAVKILIDIPLLDENGEITTKSLEAIQIGEEHLRKINSVINE